MTADFAYDPVTAIDEAQAVGETPLFGEIRQTMRIPLVTSIWRGLAGMDDNLRPAWVAAKPIYESGEPERALTRSVATVGLPRPSRWRPRHSPALDSRKVISSRRALSSLPIIARTF
jgi:hypothetical protein